MYRINAKSIEIHKRRPALIRYLNQLRIALRDPSLSERQRERLTIQVNRIQQELADI